jgi:two-component sensor histidine kinase
VNDISQKDNDTMSGRTICSCPCYSPLTNQSETIRRTSRLEIMVEGSQRLALRRTGKLLGLLISGAATEIRSGSQVLHPLWAEELMHRAYNMLRLCQTLEHAKRDGQDDRFDCNIEFALARDLATQYRALVEGPEYGIVPCSAILRGVVTNLVELFGSIREVQLHTDIEPVSLLAYQRRALVLAASELVINALRHAFKGRRHGRIAVILRVLSYRHARLTVADDGIGCDMGPVEAERGVAGGLARVLQAELICGPYSRTGTVSQITFPMRF